MTDMKPKESDRRKPKESAGRNAKEMTGKKCDHRKYRIWISVERQCSDPIPRIAR
jgi:hypothetical protein